MAFLYQMTDTWNNASQTWRGIELNVTDTGSQSDSSLMRIRRNNTTIFEVSKTGQQASNYSLTTDAFNAQTGTTYTLQSTDNGRVVTLNNASPVTLTCPAGLGAAFSCMIIQLGAGQVTVSAGGGATLSSAGALVHLAAQYAMATIIAPTANNFVLGGNIA